MKVHRRGSSQFIPFVPKGKSKTDNFAFDNLDDWRENLDTSLNMMG